MFLVVTGNFDKDEVMKVIKENQSNKTFKKYIPCKLKKYNEPLEVVKEKEIIKCNTDVPKMAYSIKIPILDIDKRKQSIMMYLIFNILFGDTSTFDEELKKDGIITNTLSYNLLDIDSHYIITLANTGDRYEELIEKIDNKLKDMVITDNDLERKKRVLISNEVFSYENIEMVNDMIVDNVIFDNTVPDNIIEVIKSITTKEINNLLKKIDFSNKSIVILKK